MAHAAWIGAALCCAGLACGETPDKPVDHKAPVQDAAWMDLRMGKGTGMLYSSQELKPEGQLIDFGGRFCSIALARSNRYVLIKTSSQLVSVDADAFKGVQNTAFPAENGGSMHGLAVSADGATAYVTGGKDRLFIVDVATNGTFAFRREVKLADGEKPVNPLGVALLSDGKRALVARSIANDVVLVDLEAGKIEARIPVGICPYSVAVSKDGKTAFVSNYGGGRPGQGQKTEKSAGSAVAVDARSVAAAGTVSVIELEGKPREAMQIRVGLHPSEVLLSPDGARLYVANVGGDSVSVIDPSARQVVATLNTKADPSLPWGSLSDGLALSEDGRTLYVANAGLNAVACIRLDQPDAPPRLIPAGWYPGGLLVRGQELFVSNVRNGLQKIPTAKDEAEVLARDARARANAHLAFALRSAERSVSDVKPVPVPAKVGEPSVIKHVVYVIKENKTYDQVLGDLGRGNGDPKLCTFGPNVIPNHKALATEFPLLDNYYCNGVNSSDGHAWVLQGLTTPYREKDRPGYRCAYDFGTDALFAAACGFTWDLVLMAGLSFRNYGELDYPDKVGGKTYNDFYTDWKNKTGKTGFRSNYHLEVLRKYSCPTYPGWEMAIPDQVRADAFLKELADFEQRGHYPNFTILYLPNDHGASELHIQSYVADNDLALGRCVEGLSKSRFWKEMAVIVIEDDPQSGHDHVDGHRSICFIASPWAKRGAIVSKFYNESAILHTIGRILGLPPLNQLVAAAPTLEDCFQATPDLTPYTCRVPEFPLNLPKAKPRPAVTRVEKKLEARIAALDFTKPDVIDQDAHNRQTWREARPGEPYPAAFAGAHGKGLKALGLTLADFDDDDD
jgi:YVTN family beta-propeller protein